MYHFLLNRGARRVVTTTRGGVGVGVATTLVLALVVFGPNGVARASTANRTGASIARSYGTGKGFCASGTSPKNAGGYFLGANFDNVWACGPPVNDNEGNMNFDVPPFDTSVVGYQCAEMANRWLWHATGHLAYADGWVFVQAASTATNLPIGHPGGTSLPRPGDIMSMGTSDPGHVIVIDGASANLYTSGTGSLTFLDENASPSGSDSVAVKNWRIASVYGYPTSSYSWLKIPGYSNPIPANGSFVDYQGTIYRVAGGAPLAVSNWANVGGGHPFVTLTTAQWDADGFGVGGPHQYPANGTEVAIGNAADHGSGFVFAGGAPLAVTNWANVNAHPSWTVVDGSALDDFSGVYDHARQYPIDGTEVAIGNAADHGSGFVFAGGAPLAVTNWANVNAHPSWTIVDGNALDRYSSSDAFHAYSHVRRFPMDGTAVAFGNPGPTHGSGYLFAGGAPLPVAKWSNVGLPPWVVIDGNALDRYASPDQFHSFSHVRDYPNKGTFLSVRVGTKKGVWRVVGGYAFRIASCSALSGGCAAEVVADGIGIQSAGGANDHLTAAPLNGTIVEGMPSKTFWSISGGKRTKRGKSTPSFQVDDTSLATIPIA